MRPCGPCAMSFDAPRDLFDDKLFFDSSPMFVNTLPFIEQSVQRDPESSSFCKCQTSLGLPGPGHLSAATTHHVSSEMNIASLFQYKHFASRRCFALPLMKPPLHSARYCRFQDQLRGLEHMILTLSSRRAMSSTKQILLMRGYLQMLA